MQWLVHIDQKLHCEDLMQYNSIHIMCTGQDVIWTYTHVFHMCNIWVQHL